MKSNRTVDLQGLVAVVLSSSLVLSQSVPAFAGVMERTAAPTTAAMPTLPVPVSNVSLPPMSGAAPLSAPLAAPSGAIPAALPPQAAATAVPALAAAQAPLAPQARPQGAAPKTLLGRLAARLAPASASASAAGSPGPAARGSGPSFNRDGQSALYDNAVKASGGDSAAAAVDAGDWTASPALPPLATLKPAWRPAEKPSAPALRQDYSGVLHAQRAESEAVLTETLSMPAAATAIKDLTSDEDAIAYGRRERYQADGAGSVALAGNVLAFVDAEGRVVLHDRGNHNTVRVSPPLGKAERLVASQDGKYLYVVAGGALQRWDLGAREAAVVMDETVLEGGVLELTAVKSADGLAQGVDVRLPGGHVFWAPGTLARSSTGSESISAETGAPPALRDAGAGFYLESRPEGTRLWGRAPALVSDAGRLIDLGTVPAAIKAVTGIAGGKTVLALTDDGFIEWDLAEGRFRAFAVDGLRSALALGGHAGIDASADGRRVLISAGSELFFADLGSTPRGEEAAEAEAREWSDAHPMFIKDGVLHIGDFTFPVKQSFESVHESTPARLWRTYVTRKPAPQGRLIPPVSREQWEALNLPSNKKALYQTLKGFSLGQNVLYIGETGGGKTWMSSTLSKLIGKKLYMVSFTEYTKNQDLLYSRTFGEEAKGKTGKTLETVLQWLNDPEGGILLLDEMHKPLEGIAALNNVLQNLSYHFSGRDIKGDRKTHFVIGTMNPVKPPYKGEPPSGELSSRFGTTVQVNYLPPAEEAALMSIFYPGSPAEINRKLAAIAKELRKIYPDVLPLPISSRTLLYIAEHIARFPGDDAVEIFKTTYNPGTIVEDPSIMEAIDKALRAHDLKGDRSKKG